MGRWTDTTNLTVAFCNFADTSKNCTLYVILLKVQKVRPVLFAEHLVAVLPEEMSFSSDTIHSLTK